MMIITIMMMIITTMMMIIKTMMMIITIMMTNYELVCSLITIMIHTDDNADDICCRFSHHADGAADADADVRPEVGTGNRTQRVPREQALAVSREAPSPSERISPG